MCGIAGYSHATDLTRRMTPHLLWEIESRGKDSWGATDGTNTVKSIGAVTESWHRYESEVLGWSRAIFHTRGASTGSVTIPNQHPFTFEHDDRKIVGIHNGIISNHFALNNKYSRSFDVDSMHIFANMVERKPTGDLQGWGNLAWYSMSPAHPEGLLNLLRFNNDACHIAKMVSGEIIFCSTPDPIRRAARMCGGTVKFFYETKEEYIYTCEIEPKTSRMELYKSNNRLPFGTRTSYQHGGSPDGWPSINVGGNRGNHGFTSPRTSDMSDYNMGLCAVVGCREKTVSGSRKTSILCVKHYQDAMDAAAMASVRRNTSVEVIA